MVHKKMKRSLSVGGQVEKTANSTELQKKKLKIEKPNTQNGKPESMKFNKLNAGAQKKIQKDNVKNKKKQKHAQNESLSSVADDSISMEQNDVDMESQEKKSVIKKEKLKVKKEPSSDPNKTGFKEGGKERKQTDLSANQLQERIEEMQSRENLSKTAKKKLAAYKKKLSELQEGSLSTGKPVVKQQTTVSNKKQKKQGVEAVETTQTKIKVEGTGSPGKIAKAAKKGKSGSAGGSFVKINKKVAEDKDDAIEKEEEEDDENSDVGSLENDDDVEMEEAADEAGDEDDEEIESDDDEDEDEDDEEEEDDDEDDDDDEDEDEDEETVGVKVKREQDVDNEEDEDDDKKVSKKKSMKATVKKEKTEKDSEQQPKKKRYVLFVGNVPFNITIADIEKHFLTKVKEVTAVRLPLRPGTKTPRGFAYVEFPTQEDFEKGFSLNHSFLNGRRINVLYTCGGNDPAARNAVMTAKNKKLQALRAAGKFAGSKPFHKKGPKRT